jgi:oxepin-CoA hydrolase / 3-oxo-5,6-dehydrosuberyl-CoA semialdehyde dehydrogenase
MMKVRFDVDDFSLRDTFLRTFFFGALDGLRPETPALWGHMTAQQMVEHLTWTFEVSTGRVLLECPYPEEQRAKMKPFLHHNRPTPREFMNPALREGLPALRHPDLKSASAALMTEVDRFLEHSRTRPDTRHTHPIFGPASVEDWSRTHFKHACHHLMQFGLIAVEAPPKETE